MSTNCMCCFDRLLEKGFFHRAMRYERQSERKRKLKESSEKKEIPAVTNFVSVCFCMIVETLS